MGIYWGESMSPGAVLAASITYILREFDEFTNNLGNNC